MRKKVVLFPVKFTHWGKTVITELWQNYEPQLSVPQQKLSQLNYNAPYWPEKVLGLALTSRSCAWLLLHVYSSARTGEITATTSFFPCL